MSQIEIGPYQHVQDVLRQAFVKVESGEDVTAVVDLVHAQVPDEAVRDWILVARILSNSALIVVKGCLAAPGVPRRIRRVLRGLLDRAHANGLAEELTEERLLELRDDIDHRPVGTAEVVGPLLFVLEVLSMNTDPSVEAAFLLS